MRIKMLFSGTLINAKSEKSRDGKNTYYKVSLDQEGEAGSLSCTEDVYDLFQNGGLERFTNCSFNAVFDDQYKNLRVFDVRPED